ncbi:hypothetical protein NEF87_004807 [Candidatus Lokiarchaeum ossiferum]|uniref:Uncharacterized protein n=1 Tax=Candidatus Lokiarchaeum ossiferum TaxID=2951803 RepID=A0ABY6I074_9ARCH|nr:hypothetical protein NEF87_004807 [Candidatus Lokiarchaeum sp. B-35]
MIKGFIIVKSDQMQKKTEQDDSEEENGLGYTNTWKIIAKYVPDPSDVPEKTIIDSIIERLNMNENGTEVNVRQFPLKFHASTLGSDEEGHSFHLISLLEISESLEIVKTISSEIKRNLFDNYKDQAYLKTKLHNIYDAKVNILEKVLNSEILTKNLSAKANKLIDEGDFEQAQELIKMAKDLPAKFVEFYEKGRRDAKTGNYRGAEKNFLQCYDLAGKISDLPLQYYIKLKIEDIKQIPSANKELRSQMMSISKDLGKFVNYLPYKAQIKKLNRCVELADVLEDDAQLEELAELEKKIIQANSLVEKLTSVERSIKNIINSWKN